MTVNEKEVKFLIDISKLINWSEEVGNTADSMSCMFSFIDSQMYQILEEDAEDPKCAGFFEQTLMHIMTLHDRLKEMGKKAGLA
jgi:hypothetical protein